MLPLSFARKGPLSLPRVSWPWISSHMGAIRASMNLSQPTASVASGDEGALFPPIFGASHSVTEEGFGITFDALAMWHSVVIVRSCTN